MTKFTELVSKQSREAKLAELGAAINNEAAQGMTLGAILTELEADDPARRELLMSVTPVELRAWFTASSEKKPRASKESTDRPIQEWDAAKEGFTAKVLAFLTEKGVGEGDYARGFSPAQLRAEATLGGSEAQMREVLKSLEDAKKVVFTGDTKGKRYVVASLKAQAEKAHAAFVEAKKAKEAAAAAKKAEDEKAGKPAKGAKKA